MRPADLTPVEIADLLAEAYAQDQGYSLDGPTQAERTALADYLGCHEAVRAKAWELMRADVLDEDAAAYWLDVEFIQPCPQDQAHA